MGNTSTKESRPDTRGHRPGLGPDYAASSSQPSDRHDLSSARARGRVSRSDLGGLLGMTTHASTSAQPPYERRETKQEREARRLERERQARLVERERSTREEHVDGGYLVTLGTYVGPEDYNKPVVRQLQIERRLAPFWRGLQDLDDNWAEHQIIAAARGMPIPPADETPPEELMPRPLPSESPPASTPSLTNLTVPLGDRSLSVSSDKSGANAGSTLPSPTSAGPARGSSPFKPRAKALAAALSVSSRNGSTTEIAPREINLPNDPFVNGQPMEVFLYKDATECPICFLSYPPYLNHTRCCDQSICSECFVQIKRADPHYPEGHGDNNSDNPNINPEEQAGQLISEPACCPYCQQPEFGVTYDPPPFRRGLAYSLNPSLLPVGAQGTAMSSSSSLNSTLSPSSLTPPAGITSAMRRRTQSLSAGDPNVITTDRVRSDWSTKLATQRAHIARRAAAATALHTAAFLMGNTENRTFRVGRFSRRNTGPGGGSHDGETSPSQGNGNVLEGSTTTVITSAGGNRGGGILVSNDNRRSRMEDLEELMFREALRQSLATEEERRRKSEKEERKEAKRREKEERKAAKKQGSGSGPYGGSGPSSASGSSLSLSGLGIGRRRGNSAASNLRVEASVANAVAIGGTVGGAVGGVGSGQASPTNAADKGKAVDRSPIQEEESTTSESQDPAQSASAPRPVPSPHQPAGPSHLRQMSSASSVDSDLPDSLGGSYQNPSHLQDPRASGLSLGSRSGASEDGGDHGDDRDPSINPEPMFNFSSLAEMVGVQLEGEHAGRRLSAIGRDALKGGGASEGKEADSQGESGLLTEGGASTAKAPETLTTDAALGDTPSPVGSIASDTTPSPGGVAITGPSESTSSKIQPSTLTPPELLITPETPAPVDDGDESKQLGFDAATVERSHQVTQ